MWLSYFHAAPFGQTDPLFGREIGFYVFRLPVYQAVRQQALLVSVIALFGCLLYYVLSGSFVVETRPGLSSWPRIRLVTVGAAPPVAARGTRLWADGVGRVAADSDDAADAGVLQRRVRRVVLGRLRHDPVSLDIGRHPRRSAPPLRCGRASARGPGRFHSPWRSTSRCPWWPACTPGLIQRFLVIPNEQNMEQPFIEHNIAATRRAYGLNEVEEREISGDAELTARDIIQNAGTVENVRLWDHEQLLQTFAQIQSIRTYYDFQNIDNDRYMIDGKLRQVMLSVRELNTESMPTRSWVNERLTFTHGYGLTLGPVNQVTTEGLPVLFVRDLPPVSTVDLQCRPAERLLRGAVEHLRPRQDADSPSSTIREAKPRRGRGAATWATRRRPTPGRVACRWDRSCAG